MPSSSPKWVERFDTWVSPSPVKPGVWHRRDGGYVVRARPVDPRTGKLREIRRVLKYATAVEAYNFLQEEIRKIKIGIADSQRPKMRLAEYAARLVEHKVKSGEIRSAATRRRWKSTLINQILPEFGDYYVDQIRRADLLRWRTELGTAIAAGKYSPRSCSGWLKVLKVIIRSYVREYELERDPTLGVPSFDTSMHRTYTREQPNSLTADELRRFLEGMLRLFPDEFAMAALGFTTGLRTCSLRPLRRQGPTPDLILEGDQGVLLNRRSHTEGQEVMERTKIGVDQEIALPQDLVEILKWHIGRLPEGPMLRSDLLFPDENGNIASRHRLWQRFRIVAREVGISKRITPHGMRRTSKDLLRQAGASQVVSMAISGHLTEQMHQHYSTVTEAEQRESLAKVISLAGFKKALEAVVLPAGAPQPGDAAAPALTPARPAPPSVPAGKRSKR
jgi:integrase